MEEILSPLSVPQSSKTRYVRRIIMNTMMLMFLMKSKLINVYVNIDSDNYASVFKI